MFLDPAAYLRLDVEGSLGATSTGASFATSTGDMLEVTAYAGGAFRLRLGPNTRPDYGLLVGRARACTVAQGDASTWTLASGDASLEIASSPLRVRLSWKGAPILGSITDEHVNGWARFPAFGRAPRGGLWTAALALESGEAVYGLGEKFGSLDKRGQLIHSQVEDAQGANSGLAYKNAPFAWSPGSGAGAWGLFVHTPAMVTHGVGHPDWSHRSYAIVVDDEALDLFLFAAPSPAGILDAYTALTGRPAPVPRWSLGLWFARQACETPEAAVAFAQVLRDRRIPSDVLVLDDACTWPAEAHFDFAWDRDRFPEPRAMIDAIRERNLRVAVWESPYVSVQSRAFRDLAQRGYLLRTAQGEPYVFGRAATGASPVAPPDSALVDFTNPDAFAWWRDAHRDLFASGVAAIDADAGEHVPDDAVTYSGDWGRRVHNVYPLLYGRCVFEATAQLGAEEDAPPVIASRAGWSGSQRYPIAGSGDVQSDWEGLAACLRGALSWGMSGNAFHAIDVGGAYSHVAPTAELYVRWLQAAVFASHVRIHGADGREPWAFGPEVEAVCRKWLAFRYRLVPYLEAVAAASCESGLPVMRAMPLAFPGNPLVRHYDTQFMCGDALLVAPVLRPGGEVEVALPPGGWFDLNTRQRIAGRQVVRYRAKLDQFPIFAREGHALPLGRAVQYTGEIDAERPVELLWLFGKPAATLDRFAQVRIEAASDASFSVRVASGVRTEGWGDAASLGVGPL